MVRRSLLILAVVVVAALLAALLWNLFSEARADLDPGDGITTDPAVTVADPGAPLAGTTNTTTAGGPSTVRAADTTGTVRRLDRAVPPAPGRRPVVVLTGPDGESAPDAPVVIDAPASTSGPGLFPEFFPRPVVTVSTVGRGLADSVDTGGRTRVVATVQPRPLIEVRPTVIAGADMAPGLTRPGAFVAVSPVRVWGFRPDLGVRYALGSPGEAGEFDSLDRVSLSAGVSIEVLDRLRVRAAVPIERVGLDVPGLGRGPGVQVGVGYRFR